MHRRALLRESSPDTDEGFGPGTDLVVSVLALLLMMLTLLRLTSVAAIGGDLNPGYLNKSKREFIAALEEAFGRPVERVENQPDVRRITSQYGVVEIRDFATAQRISFGEGVLFDNASHVLQPRGLDVLDRFRRALEARSSTLMEVQVSGHADTNGTPDYNLRLGSDRAMAVYQELLRGDVGALDPARVLFSATTFGQFSPVTRDAKRPFSGKELAAANRTDAQWQANRRVEVAILYYLSSPAAGIPSASAPR